MWGSEGINVEKLNKSSEIRNSILKNGLFLVFFYFSEIVP